MFTFTVWNPHSLKEAPHILEFVIINAETVFDIGANIKFAQDVLRDLDIDATVLEWSAIPYRSNYYSDYDTEWQDVWKIIWRARVVVAEPLINLPDQTLTSWLGVDAYFTEAQPSPNDEDPIRCLAIADFDSEYACKQAQDQINNDEQVKMFILNYKLDKPTMKSFPILSSAIQLQIDLGILPSDFFATGADYATYLLELCRQAGGTTHYRKRSW